MILRMAWRNTWRNPRRTGIVAVSVAIGIAGCVLSMALNLGLVQGMVNTAIETGLGHVQLHAAGYEDEPELRVRLADGGETVIAAIEYSNQSEVLPILLPVPRSLTHVRRDDPVGTGVDS